MTLDEALDAVGVIECDEMNEACRTANLPANHPPGWWGVTDDESGGVRAYFADERAAFRWRLAEINRLLNG